MIWLYLILSICIIGLDALCIFQGRCKTKLEVLNVIDHVSERAKILYEGEDVEFHRGYQQAILDILDEKW